MLSKSHILICFTDNFLAPKSQVIVKLYLSEKLDEVYYTLIRLIHELASANVMLVTLFII